MFVSCQLIPASAATASADQRCDDRTVLTWRHEHLPAFPGTAHCPRVWWHCPERESTQNSRWYHTSFQTDSYLGIYTHRLQKNYAFLSSHYMWRSCLHHRRTRCLWREHTAQTLADCRTQLANSSSQCATCDCSTPERTPGRTNDVEQTPAKTNDVGIPTDQCHAIAGWLVHVCTYAFLVQIQNAHLVKST